MPDCSRLPKRYVDTFPPYLKSGTVAQLKIWGTTSHQGICIGFTFAELRQLPKPPLGQATDWCHYWRLYYLASITGAQVHKSLAGELKLVL